MHMRIKRDANSRQFMLSDFSRTFLTIPDMVHHYTRNRLPIRGAEHMCLKKPVHIQLLWGTFIIMLLKPHILIFCQIVIIIIIIVSS